MVRKRPKLSELTLEEKIGQTHVERQHILAKVEDYETYFKDKPCGSVWMFGYRSVMMGWANEAMAVLPNTSDTSCKNFLNWVREMDSHLKIPLLPAMDMRVGLKVNFSDLTEVPGPPCLGAANSPELAYEWGECMSAEFDCAGAKWWWGPEVDVIKNRFRGIHHCRTASDNPDKILKITKQQVASMQKRNIAATVKHFPSADPYEFRDPHFSPSCNMSTFEEWWEMQGRVYQELIDSGVYSMMISHTAFPAVDDSMVGDLCRPATISYKIITGLLKEKMGFKGVVITDAITMASVSTLYPQEQLVVEALKAGNDVILGPDLPNYVEVVKRAVLSGELPESRIDDACTRVLDMKEKLGMFEPDYVLGKELEEAVLERTRAMSKKLAEKSLTLMYDKKNRLPFDSKEIKKVAIICSTHVDSVFDNLENMKKSFEKRGATVHLQRRLRNAEEMKQIADENDLIVYAAYIMPHQPIGMPAFYGDECRTFSFAFRYGKEKSVGISLGSPYLYYDYFSNINTFVNAYNSSPETQEAFVAAIYGEIPFEGVSPFKTEPDRGKVY